MLLEQCQKIGVNEVVQQAIQQKRQELVQAGIMVGDYSVKITTSNTQFGGQRAWFVCPTCERRCGVLLQHPLSRTVGCRECLALGYRKQRYKGMIENTSEVGFESS